MRNSMLWKPRDFPFIPQLSPHEGYAELLRHGLWMNQEFVLGDMRNILNYSVKTVLALRVECVRLSRSELIIHYDEMTPHYIVIRYLSQFKASDYSGLKQADLVACVKQALFSRENNGASFLYVKEVRNFGKSKDSR
jgi:hypothetical protein